MNPESESYIIEEDIRFEDAFCIDLKIKYNRYGAEHYNIFITISADCISIGQTDNWINNNWLNT
jgi:hypothetical protein